ncbi:hypothetical protein [Halobaculum gomorrense]|uniref:Uncharacterized protein n=1 Tax=Halobaculum gomorrense TaxID=43928 RepID=A0A1M5NVL5_9EURY|nr:hypothetical protein [Halobaculum gomorrense]SHG93518.1 hypothetical protein SAMN05443636_1360 [Halobaculum gomorrense]
MGVHDTHGSDAERRVEPAEEPPAGLRRVFGHVRRRLAEWSEVHAKQQVEMLAGEPPER